MTEEIADLSFVPVERKTGDEHFHRSGYNTDDALLGFWQWSGSDLLGNTARGILAEYIVALDLGIADGVRYGWDAYDLKTDNGIAVEVKSASYIQSWKQKTYSKLRFGIAPTLGWDPHTDRFSEEPARWSDAYVFCVLACRDPKTVDPLDLDQWEFYVLPTHVLNNGVPNQKTIGLSSLLQLGAQKAVFGEIGTTIRSALGDARN